MEVLTIPTEYTGEVQLRSYDTGGVRMRQKVDGRVPLEVRGKGIEAGVYMEDKASIKMKTRSGDAPATIFVTPAVARRVDVWLSHVNDNHIAE